MPEQSETLCAEHQYTLLHIGGQAICLAASEQKPLFIDAKSYAPPLQCIAACFVTLKIRDKLRGCIGTLDAREPLVCATAHNAYAAAINDYRFNPLEIDELPRLHYHISVLSAASPISVANEADLLARLRPDIDGLILRWGAHQATFLPSVWEQLPEPTDFIRQLKLKAGLAADFWANDMEISRYTSQGFSATLGSQPLSRFDFHID